MDNNLEKAINKALKIAKSTDETMYVFYEGYGEYAIGNDFDSQTFFLGNTPICVCYSDGNYEA